MRIKHLSMLLMVSIFFFVLIPVGSTQNEQQVMQINENRILYNGVEISFSNEKEELSSYTFNNVTYVPLRSFANIMGKNVQWNAENMNIAISDTSVTNADGKEIGSYFKYSGVEELSMVQLLANPKAYEGKKILVGGVLNVGFEMDFLYLTCEDRMFHNIRNAVYLNFRTKNILGVPIETLEGKSGAYAFIEGTFKSLYPEENSWIIVDINLIETREVDKDGNIHSTFFGR